MKTITFIMSMSDFHALATSTMKLTYLIEATLKLNFIKITKNLTMIYFNST